MWSTLQNIINLKTYLLVLGFTFGLNFSSAQVTADFEANVTEGCGALAGVQFTDLSSGNITTWSWSFGNQNTSSIQNPIASFPAVGSYTITLTVSDGTFTDTETKVAYIEVHPVPTADFTFTPTGGCTPLDVQFTSTSSSTNTITNYLWDFGDGNQSSSGPNVTHTFQSAGNASPSLEIIDQFGCKGTILKNNVISITPSPVAGITTLNPRVDCNIPYTVNFQASVLNALSNTIYKWDFGDGSQSTAENPSHTYTAYGKYNVSLIVINPNCSDTLTEFEYVRLAPSAASFVLPKKEFCLGDTLKPINNSTGTRLFQWQLSNGYSTTEAQPKIALKDSGKIVIDLTAAASGNCFASIKDSIYVQQLVSDFTTDTVSSCRGDSTVFTATSNHSANYEWRLGVELGSDTLFGNPLKYREPFIGTFSDTLYATSSIGCKDTLIKADNRLVEAILPLIAENGRIIAEDTLKGCLPLVYNFEDSSLSNYPITSYNWNFSNGQTSTLPNASNIVFDQLGKYYFTLTLTDAKGCSAFIERWVNGGEKHNPDYLIFPDTLCPVDSVTIVDKSTPQNRIDSYTISFLGLNDSTSFPIDPDTFVTSFEKKFQGAYSINYTVSEKGCDSILKKGDSIYLKGPAAEPIINAPCNNRRNISFSANATHYTYFAWDFGDGTPLETININPTHFYQQAGTYNARLTLFNDTNGCDTVTFDVVAPAIDLPPLKIRPDSMQYCLDDEERFFNRDSSFYIYTRWYLNDEPVGSKNFIELEFDSTGTFPFVMECEDVYGCIYRHRDTLFISQPEAKIGSRFIQNCAPVEVDFIDSSITDTNIVSWFWDFGNGSTSTQARDTTVYPVNSSTDVFLKVENKFGCKDSILVKDYLQSKVLDVDFREGATALCEGDSILFRNNSSGLNATYQWTFGDGDQLSSAASTFYHTYEEAGIYTVSLAALDENGCRDTLIKNQLIDVDSIPDVDFVADQLMAPCPPLNVQFTDLSSADVNQWKWTLDPNQQFKPAIQNPQLNYTLPGSYDISLWVSTPNGCQDSLTKTNYITVGGPRGDINIKPDFACKGDTLEFEVISPGGLQTAYWDFGDGRGDTGLVVFHAYDTTGTVFPTVILKDTNDCQLEPKQTSFSIFQVSADFNFPSDSICEPASIIPINLSEGADNYFWNFGNGQQSNLENPSIEYNSAGNYDISLKVYANIGCIDSVTKTLTVKPRVNLSSTPDTTICLNDTIFLRATGADHYTWSSASEILNADTVPALVFPKVSDSFKVKGNNQFNCPDSTTILVNVFNPPTEPFLQDTSLIIGEEVMLNGFSGEGFLYQWVPTTGVSCPSCPDPLFKPEVSTEYTLQISDPFGCFPFEKKVFIEIIEKYSLDVPQVFSPNGDDVNDVVYAKGWGLKELISFKIYNRFGEIVFESQDFDKGWDGTYRGKDQNVETYVYTVEALTYGGKVLRKKGNLNLIR
ncbi:MAG: PKD domain-containing protein [Vicingaceae bacterium]